MTRSVDGTPRESPHPMVPEIRLQTLNPAPIRPDGDFVLYWMVAHRRAEWNFALDRAIDHAQQLRKPLVVLEALRCDYPWASDRMHRFVLQGMAENARRFAPSAVHYYPFVETRKGEGRGLLESLLARAAVVVSDLYPCFFLPRMQNAAAGRSDVHFEIVDGNGLFPLRATEKVFARAVDLRRFLQKNLPPHLLDRPVAEPLKELELPRLENLPEFITQRWPAASQSLRSASSAVLAELPIDHNVPGVDFHGGTQAAEDTFQEFLGNRLDRYQDDRNRVTRRATSELSPYLHFGHISVHRLFHALAQREGWHPGKLGEQTRGAREGWWGMSGPTEGFLDELVTWRELGFNMCWHRSDYDRYESLPPWARKTLEDHQNDPRPYLYDLEEFENAQTHDEVWNAAQRELKLDGRIHNYLRMLWGKKILEWSPTPQDALAVMIELNNKYAVDGRDPNSYSGIFWCLGRYDRAWGPERPIYGKIRYMTSDGARRKIDLAPYLARYGPLSTS